jgi:hypothetical protein
MKNGVRTYQAEILGHNALADKEFYSMLAAVLYLLGELQSAG